MKIASVETIEYIKTTARLTNEVVYLKSKGQSWYATDKEPLAPYYVAKPDGKVSVKEC
jgi:hypothetical protein